MLDHLSLSQTACLCVHVCLRVHCVKGVKAPQAGPQDNVPLATPAQTGTDTTSVTSGARTSRLELCVALMRLQEKQLIRKPPGAKASTDQLTKYFKHESMQ